MTNLQKAITAAALINTLFNEYKAGELNSAKSAFAGKKLTIVNNLILDGKKIAEGF